MARRKPNSGIARHGMGVPGRRRHGDARHPRHGADRRGDYPGRRRHGHDRSEAGDTLCMGTRAAPPPPAVSHRRVLSLHSGDHPVRPHDSAKFLRRSVAADRERSGLEYRGAGRRHLCFFPWEFSRQNPDHRPLPPRLRRVFHPVGRGGQPLDVPGHHGSGGTVPSGDGDPLRRCLSRRRPIPA